MSDGVYTIPSGFRRIPEEVNIAEEVLYGRPNGAVPDERTALKFDDGVMSYGELRKHVGRFSLSLLEIGVERHSHVILRMQNSPEFAIAFLGLLRIGAIPVLQNSQAAVGEFNHVCERTNAVCVVTLASLADPIREGALQLEKGLIVARGALRGEHVFEDMVKLHVSPVTFPAPARTGADEPAFIVYTSGTTGKPKGIVHAHRWVIALGDSNRLRLPQESTDVVLHTGEWSFIAALGQNLLFPLRNGAQVAILEGRATPERVLDAIGKYGVTLLFSVATVYRRILAMRDFERRYNLSSLRGCNSTGESLERAVGEEWKRRAGCDIWEHYGISEMQMVFGQGPTIPLRSGSVGVPLPGPKVAILDDNYNPVPIDTIGNLLIGADDPGFFLGYQGDPELTARVMRDGWYHTGDLARRDEDGYIWLAGRSDDCFKSRGIFISPVEIEDAVRQHPAVVEVCVIPRPDPEIGNKICAVIVPHEINSADAELAQDIIMFLRYRIAAYKVPHLIEFVLSLPRSAIGKVLRRELRAEGITDR